MDFPPTKLDYHVDMFNLQSQSRFLSLFKAQDGRTALILDSTVFHPQGGGQPSDTGFIVFSGSDFKFSVQDVRSKDGIVLHYGVFEGESEMEIEKGKEVLLTVDESRRKLNSRLHSAGHLLDLCMQKVGLGHLEPGKGYHFPDGPFVEYKGSVPQDEMQVKQKELEAEANQLITKGGKVYAALLPYEEASLLCGGNLPDYIPKGSTPRIIKLGDNPGCPCGVPMVAWPLYAEQRFNRVVIVEEIKIAIPMNESEIGFVSSTEVEKRVQEIMQEGPIRERTKAMKKAAESALIQTGSSHAALTALLQSWSPK